MSDWGDSLRICPRCREEKRSQSVMKADTTDSPPLWRCPQCGLQGHIFISGEDERPYWTGGPLAVPDDLPPHFPRADADPAAILEARIVELEEINAAQYAEMKAWQTQLEHALERLRRYEHA